MLRLAALINATLMLTAGITLAATSEIPIKGSEKILISVPEAVVNVQATSGKVLRVTLSAGAAEDYTLKTEGNQIRIEAKESLQNGGFGPIPSKKRLIEISGPSVGLEIHAFDGQIQLNKWGKEALVHLQKGRFVSRDGQGSLVAHMQNGEIQILEHQGRVDVDSYKASVTVKNLNGDLDLENFAGESVVDKVKGFLSLNQGAGSSKITGSSGSMQFDLVKGILNVQAFQGRVEGQTQEGPVNVSLAPEADVNIKSQTGRVTVNTPSGSGAFLNLLSQEGEIQAPNYMKVIRDGSQKSLKGRLKGDSQKGSVVVRSQAASIIIR